MLDFIHSGMTRSSIYDNDFLELVWENGQVVVKGGSSNRAQKTPNSCKGYSISPPHKGTTIDHEDACITKKTRLSTLYSLFDHFPSQRDSDMSSSHQSNGHDSSQFSQTKNPFKLNEEFANLLRPEKDSKKVTTGNNNSHLCTYPSQPSCPVPKKQKTDSDQTTPATNSHNFGCDQRARKVNFSNFSIPAMFLKSTSYHGKSAPEPTKYARVEEIEASKVEKAEAVESAKGSDIGLKGIQKQTPIVERREETPHDEHSEAIRIHKSYGQPCNQTSNSEALRAKGKANNNTNLCNEPLLASSSVCSLGASNDPSFATRRHEDTDESTYLSDNDGEAEDVVKQTPDREGSRVKRSRNPEVHNLSEKKRRGKINKKMRALKELIPNCNKVDNASMLDDAIDYLKTLKLQLQIMSMGNGLWPLMNMMLPAAAHHMNGPQLMGFRPPQFPIPPLSAITDNRLHHMFGFNNQIPQMPIPHAPFFPIIPNSNSTQPHLPTSTATTTTNLGERLPNSTPLHVSVPMNSHLHAKAENVAMQVPNQVSLHQHCTSPPAIPFTFPQ